MWNNVRKLRDDKRQQLPLRDDNRVVCHHTETIGENGGVICVDCGKILESYFLVDTPSTTKTVNRTKRRENTIYNEIPSYIAQDVKTVTVEIYEAVTEKRIFRNVFRRSIILACLHRASILKECPIFFDEMLELFNLKIHDANKGISFVAMNIDRFPTYRIPFWNDDICLNSIVVTTDLRSIKPCVERLFGVIKSRSDLLNSSHCKSIVCGCIYFVIKYKNMHISLNQFSAKCGMAEMTIVKKYLDIYKILLKLCMKRLFSTLLVFALSSPSSPPSPPSPSSPSSPSSPPPLPASGSPIGDDADVLYESTENISVLQFKDPTALRIVSRVDDFEYPIDDVSDIYEWNLFLNKSYYDYNDRKKTLNVHFAETSKNIIFDFDAYDAINNESGSSILKSIVKEFIDPSHASIDRLKIQHDRV